MASHLSRIPLTSLTVIDRVTGVKLGSLGPEQSIYPYIICNLLTTKDQDRKGLRETEKKCRCVRDKEPSTEYQGDDRTGRDPKKPNGIWILLNPEKVSV